MAWVRIESSVARHQKFQQAGPAAAWLWLCGLAYCQEGLTDGFIPFEALPYLGVKSPGKHAAVLVKVRLWDQCEGGWEIHDYLHHNKSAAEMSRIIAARKEGGKSGGRPTKEPSSETLKVNLQENPTLLCSDQHSTTQRSSARAPIHSSHKSHAACGRVCVPASLHGEFVRRRNHPDADNELRDWYLAVDRQWCEPPLAEQEPGDSFDFWKARYAEKWPAKAAAKDTRPAWAQGL